MAETERAQHSPPRRAPFNPFDLTTVWPHKDYPVIDVGYFDLNRNPENYFAEIEQSSFSPSNIVPGVSCSPDKMLQARIFSYGDAHRYRVGTHYEALRVNRPKTATNNDHLVGSMRFDSPKGSDAFYEPNTFTGPCRTSRRKSRRCGSAATPIAATIATATMTTRSRERSSTSSTTRRKSGLLAISPLRCRASRPKSSRARSRNSAKSIPPTGPAWSARPANSTIRLIPIRKARAKN